MRLLVLGGTWFIGHAVAAAAVEAGWDVTVFHRGRTGSPPDGVETILGDRTFAADVRRLAQRGRWDVVADTSGYVPRNVLAVAQTLERVTETYVFMSTVSVYEGWPSTPLTDDSPTLFCPSDAGSDFGEDIEDGPTRYGYQKSGCERAVLETFGTDHAALLRPGVVLGPREYVGRLPWWLRRVAGGGRAVAPGDPRRVIQPVDVRDLASFTLTCAKEGNRGSFNVTSQRKDTFGGMLDACAAATGVRPEFVWVPDEVLLRLGVRQWSELPLWRIHDGVWRVDASRAAAAGLFCRPIADTVLDTWEWMSSSGAASDNERASEIGLSRKRERFVLEAIS